jgi:hypothetical protein
MKYTKFQQVDSITGISVLIETPKEGPVLPKIPGLDNLALSYNCQWYYGTTSDEFIANPENYIYELTKEQYAEELTEKIELLKNDLVNNLYEEEKYLRETKLGPYHDTATTAGVQKYNEAKVYLDTGVASEFLISEATLRAISVDEMCQKIVERYEKFRKIDSKISGIRGKILDRVNSFAVDQSDPWYSHEEWENKEEILVEERIPLDSFSYFTIQPSEMGTPEIIKYYSSNLMTRYNCVEYLEELSKVGIASI